MQLTNDQMEVMREVRDRFKAGQNKSQYICNILGEVLGDWSKSKKISTDQEYALERSLRFSIEAAIAGHPTFAGFLLKTCRIALKVMEEKDRKTFEDFMWQARMAWLDWIVETRNIETEYVKKGK